MPVARLSACKIAWHRWEQPPLIVVGMRSSADYRFGAGASLYSARTGAIEGAPPYNYRRLRVKGLE